MTIEEAMVQAARLIDAQKIDARNQRIYGPTPTAAQRKATYDDFLAKVRKGRRR